MRIDVDNAIGGDTAFDPGRCLSLLTPDQRTAYLEDNCRGVDHTSADCNVSITATNKDADGKNDAWRIETPMSGVRGLICQMGGIVYGQTKTTLTFGYDAEKKP